MFQLLAAISGIVVATIVALNSQIGATLGHIPSSFVFHIVGLTVITIVGFFRPSVDPKEKAPFYLKMGGVVGVVIVIFSNICFQALGASLVVVLQILGRTLGGQIVDVTGFLGMEKRGFHRAKLVGWVLVIAGAALMVESFRGSWRYIFLTVFTGGLMMLTTVLNAQFAKRAGMIRGTQVSFFFGALFALAMLFLTRTEFHAFYRLKELPWPVVIGAGTLGITGTIGLNWIIPKIPAVQSAILIFLGQVSAGLFIDAVFLHAFSWRKALGALIILSGLLVKSWVDRHVPRKIAGDC